MFKSFLQKAVSLSIAALAVLNGMAINESISELLDPVGSRSEALTLIEKIAQPQAAKSVNESQQLCRSIHKGIGFATVKDNQLINFERISKDSPVAPLHRFEIVKVNHSINAYQPWEIAPDNETAKAKNIRVSESIAFFLDSLKLDELDINCNFAGTPPAEDTNIASGNIELSYAAGRYKVTQLLNQKSSIADADF